MKRILLYLIMCMVWACQMSAHILFRTAELERLATIFSLNVQSLPDGYSHPGAKGMVLTVHKSAGIVDHIGCQLFSDEMRSRGKMPVLNFLERYFLQLKYPPQVKTANMMARDDEFFFLTGSLATVDKILLTDDFACTHDRQHYQASWSRNGKTFLTVYFPVEYELLSGEDKIEAENNLMGDILRTQTGGQSDRTRLLDNVTYLSNGFSNRLYMPNGTYVISLRHPAESAANILLSLQASEGFSIKLTQLCYGFKKNVFCVPIPQWVAFCRNTGCELYFGVKAISGDGDVDAVVLAVNEQENYNHVLTVHVPSLAIERRKGTIEGRLYPYVPTHNMNDLFANYRKSEPKTIVCK